MTSKIIIIAGGGKFGIKALKYAQKKDYASIIIDSDPACAVAVDCQVESIDKDTLLKNWQTLPPKTTYFLNSDISSLFDLLELTAEYIIPVLPIHLMALLVKELFEKHEIKLTPDSDRMNFLIKNIEENLILGSNEEHATIFLSHAKKTETCPDKCIGPEDYCPTFKRPKPYTITKYVKDFFYILDTVKIHSNEITSFDIAIESKQLTSGLGGILGAEIKFVFDMIKEKINNALISRVNLMVSTTCNCHGIVNFYKSD